ncbi:HBL205Wp [Eremothecium sinecaudum]|uniref:Apurinic-apyrimidinic endonuclease 1 n=1 Tax=Eremothecium sinecaudum TaxID=45286 RepID=A0A109UX00_9SACH|nr:HBL205Wp [Eremothecium sinecaudum]AMD18697.1 HBL205Wp [Eremothecium sinecaudum]
MSAYLRSSTSKYKFGAHVSAAGGISNSVVNAFNIGCNSFAMFLKSPRQWVSKPYPKEEIAKFKENCKKYGYNPAVDILPHGSYFINLANPDPEKAEKAYGAFIDDLQRCEQLGIGLYNFHPGSSLQGDHSTQIKQLAGYINKAIKETSFVKIVLENMAGHGSLIGSNLHDLKAVIDMVENKDRVGVCVDTCHTYAAGYDISDRNSFDSFWKQFESIIGMKYLISLHLNDSKASLGANLDRHELLGEGFLGLELFKIIAKTESLQGIPIILETPQKEDEGYGEEIKLLEWLETLGDSEEDNKAYSQKSENLSKRGLKSRQEFTAKVEKKKAKMDKSTKKRSLPGSDIMSQMKRSKRSKN